jgi:hypothetical protein
MRAAINQAPRSGSEIEKCRILMERFPFQLKKLSSHSVCATLQVALQSVCRWMDHDGAVHSAGNREIAIKEGNFFLSFHPSGA